MKKEYKKPAVDIIEIDEEITVLLNSGGPHDAEELGNGWGQPQNTNATTSSVFE